MVNQKELQKINRYYVSNTGVKIIKVNKKDGREIQLEAGMWMQTLFNDLKIEPKWDNYNVNMKYYLSAIESEIDKILSVSANQLQLF